MGEIGVLSVVGGAVAFFLTVIAAHFLIPLLKKRNAGQPILEIGPSWHLLKAGTPTLGGLSFIFGIGCAALVIFCLLFGKGKNETVNALALSVFYAMLCGGIGFVDDHRKLTKRENEGLSAWQKYLLQLLASAFFLVFAHFLLPFDTAIRIPFTAARVDLGFFYYPLALLYLTGVVNALNLTDGVDGLLSSTVSVIAAFFIVWGVFAARDVVTLSGALLIGGAFGFLLFNRHPAKVFMGDTGSLFFGGMVSAVGILTGEVLLVLLASGVFVIEAASVILQVAWFKITGGKRLFLMAPLHHHFEKKGWGEERVVAVFSLVGLLFAALAFLGR